MQSAGLDNFIDLGIKYFKASLRRASWVRPDISIKLKMSQEINDKYFNGSKFLNVTIRSRSLFVVTYKKRLLKMLTNVMYASVRVTG